MKELFIENDLLLEHINCQDVMCIVMHADFENNRVLHANEDNLEYAQMEQSYIDEYSRCVELEVELSKMKDIIEKDVYNELSKRSLRLDQHYYYYEDQYAVSIKEDTAYPCLHSPKTTEDKAQYAVSRETQYAVFKIWNEYNILEDIKRGPYSKKSPIRRIQLRRYAISNRLPDSIYTKLKNEF
ncbi:hypothetical protein Tco_1299115 [Tanacetum coccineum]